MKSSIYALGEIAEITMGQSPPSDTYNTERIGLPFFQGKAEFGEEHPTPVKWCSAPLRIAEAGDILLTVRAPVGPTNIASEKCCIGRGLASIRAKPEFALTRYLLFFFRYFEEEIASKGVGSTFTAINRSDISRLKITLPPLSAQDRIVRLLDEAESLRVTRKRANVRMEDFVPATFKEMFGEMLGKNPKYQRIKFGDVITTIDFGISQALSSGAEYKPGRIPILRIANITAKGTVNYSDLRYLDISETRKIKFSLQKGDLLFNWRNSPNWVGKTAIFDDDGEYIFASFLFRIKLDNSKADNTYIWFYLNNLRRLGFFEAICRQAVSQANFGRDELANVDIMLPPLALQREFAARVEEARGVQSAQEKSSERIEALYQSMLSKAFEESL